MAHAKEATVEEVRELFYSPLKDIVLCELDPLTSKLFLSDWAWEEAATGCEGILEGIIHQYAEGGDKACEPNHYIPYVFHKPTGITYKMHSVYSCGFVEPDCGNRTRTRPPS